MSQTNSAQPDDGDNNERAKGDALHQRLLDGDPLASADIAEAYLWRVSKALKFKFPKTEDELIWNAAVEAWQNYVRKPSSFDPTKRGLLGYLKMSAEGDLKNALTKIKRENSRQVSLENVVELLDSSRNNPVEEGFIERQDTVERISAFRTHQTEEIARTTDTELDRKLMKLILSRERRTEVYAQLLQIEHLDLDEQRKLVKRHKDRLQVRLKRHQAKDA